MHPFFDGLHPTIHIAHRGGAGLAPENTVGACRIAIDTWKTHMLELDLQVTRDGVLVVAHDETVDRCTDGTGRIEDMTLGELQELDAGYRFTRDGVSFPYRGRGVRIPTLASLLRVCPEVRVNLEVKVDRPGVEELLARVLRHEDAVARACVGAESDALAERIFEALPEACHFYPRSAARAFATAVMQGDEPPTDDRWHILDLPLDYEGTRVVTPALLEAAGRAGRWVNVWTVDDQLTMVRLRRDGVGGIMTDRPDLLKEVLEL